MSPTIVTTPDPAHADAVVTGLVEHNTARSDMIRARFQPEHLRARPVVAYALDDHGTVIGGCQGRAVPVWQWLEIDETWVHPEHRAQGIGAAVLRSVEEQAAALGCRWVKLNTWDFQAPEFYKRQGYAVYGMEEDYPPGHTNYMMRKGLSTTPEK